MISNNIIKFSDKEETIMGFFTDAMKGLGIMSGVVGDSLGKPELGPADTYKEEKKEDGSVSLDTGRKIGEELRKGTK